MKSYNWPGNLRELRNLIERAVILGGGDEIGADDFAEIIQVRSELRVGGNVTLEELDNEHMRRVIANSRTIDEAAAILGVDPATLVPPKEKALKKEFRSCRMGSDESRSRFSLCGQEVG